MVDRHGASGADLDPGEADRLLDEVEQRRRGWVLVILGVLVCSLAMAVPLVLPTRVSSRASGTAPSTHRRSSQAAPMNDRRATQAAVYVAALSGGPVPHRLTHRVYVRDRVCADVVSGPVSRCDGPAIAPPVQARVRSVLGSAVVFRSDPPAPAATGVPVVAFGPLTMPTDATAHLQMATVCGQLCGQGQTLVLRLAAGRWQVGGATGPQWIS